MGKKSRQARAADMEPVDQAIEAEIEMEAVAEEAPVKIEEPKMEFDAWYAIRKNRIPTIHKKEILKADFKARKVPTLATVREFDEALKKYGVKLA